MDFFSDFFLFVFKFFFNLGRSLQKWRNRDKKTIGNRDSGEIETRKQLEIETHSKNR